MPGCRNSQAINGGRQAGFTLLELAVVIVIISTLFLFAYQHYLDLLVDVEKASVEQTVGILRSAVGMNVAKFVVDGRIDDLIAYEGANPVQFLAEVPENYEGEVADLSVFDGRSGIWYFDTTAGLLNYNVKNTAAFFSEIDGVKRLSYRLVVVYADNNKKRFSGLSLRSVDNYSWFKKSDQISPLVQEKKGAAGGN